MCINVHSGDLDDGQANEHMAHKLQKLHIADNAKTKLCHGLFFEQFAHFYHLQGLLSDKGYTACLVWDEILDWIKLFSEKLAIALCLIRLWQLVESSLARELLTFFLI